MMVLATQTETVRYQTFYIGKSDDIGRRWYEHLNMWFLNPSENYWLPVNAEEFLQDPVKVLNDNKNQLRQGLNNRGEIMRVILDQTWFCFSPIPESEIPDGDYLEHIEYVLQEALKRHSCTKVSGEIGDSYSRKIPRGNVEVFNRFGREFLEQTLPSYARFDPQFRTVLIRSEIC